MHGSGTPHAGYTPQRGSKEAGLAPSQYQNRLQYYRNRLLTLHIVAKLRLSKLEVLPRNSRAEIDVHLKQGSDHLI
jgi:hypothetical protein